MADLKPAFMTPATSAPISVHVTYLSKLSQARQETVDTVNLAGLKLTDLDVVTRDGEGPCVITGVMSGPSDAVSRARDGLDHLSRRYGNVW